MATTTTIDTITPEDPYRTAISAISGRDQVTIAYTPTNDGNLYPSASLVPDEDLVPGVNPIFGIRVEQGGGTAVGTGTLLTRHGLPCSDTLLACSDTDPLMVCTDWSSPSGTQLTDTITYAETGGPADGPETIYVWACASDQGGWQ